MPTSGDVVLVDLGVPLGSEAGFPRPVVVVTAQRVLDRDPTVLQVVPLTSTIRGYESEVTIEPADGGVTQRSAAQCQHIRAVARGRLGESVGRVGPVALAQIRDVLAALLDLPVD